MSLKEKVKLLLQDNPDFRERKNRYKAIWFYIYELYCKEQINREMFLEVGPLIESISRSIRQWQQFDETLRGTDYFEGQILSQETQLELGYTPGFHNDIKLLNEIGQ